MGDNDFFSKTNAYVFPSWHCGNTHLYVFLDYKCYRHDVISNKTQVMLRICWLICQEAPQ